jgi:hypothetical protein
MAAFGESELHGHWIHAHEEDTDGEMVFRGASHPLPPSRGRMRLELRPDGAFVEHSPGPVDVPVKTSGSWSLQGGRLVLRADEGTSRSWDVARAEADRLVLRKRPVQL